MKLFLAVAVAILVSLAATANVSAEKIVWICPVIAINGQGHKSEGITHMFYPGDYVFEINVQNPLAADEIKQALRLFGSGGLLLTNAVLDKKDVKQYLVYRHVDVSIINGKLTMVIQRGDGREITIQPTGGDYFRRILYPVEPDESNGQTGWPK